MKARRVSSNSIQYKFDFDEEKVERERECRVNA